MKIAIIICAILGLWLGSTCGGVSVDEVKTYIETPEYKNAISEHLRKWEER